MTRYGVYITAKCGLDSKDEPRFKVFLENEAGVSWSMTEQEAKELAETILKRLEQCNVK